MYANTLLRSVDVACQPETWIPSAPSTLYSEPPSTVAELLIAIRQRIRPKPVTNVDQKPPLEADPTDLFSFISTRRDYYCSCPRPRYPTENARRNCAVGPLRLRLLPPGPGCHQTLVTARTCPAPPWISSPIEFDSRIPPGAQSNAERTRRSGSERCGNATDNDAKS